MSSSVTLQRLGFDDGDRVVILHADDIGMCQASLPAYADLVAFGLLSSAAVMVPCGWFPAAAAFCRAHPEVDMGVHLTLTSEWDAYRWGAISTRDPDSGMMDTEGYFYRTSESAQRWGEPEAVAVEIEMQIQRARAAGIDVTHIDTHMGSVMHPKFLQAYVMAALDLDVPAMLPRWSETRLHEYGLSDEMVRNALETIEMLEAQGMPMLDHIASLPLEELAADRVEQTKALLGDLSSGLTHFLVHPAKDTPELRAITCDWAARVADYEAMMSDELRIFIEREGIYVIGYRALRDVLRGGEVGIDC